MSNNFKNDILKKIKYSTLNDGFSEKIYMQLENLIQVALDEDLGDLGDVTSNAILKGNEKGTARILAKQNGIFAGGFAVIMVYVYIDPSVLVTMKANEGDIIKDRQIVIVIEGSIKNILIGERTALNFLSRMSGVATLTNEFVKAAERSHVKILDTRKTMPGWRFLDKYSVAVGGGYNHRIGLFDMFLIKENHIEASGGIKNAVSLCKNYLKINGLKYKIEVETKNINEVEEAIKCGVDRIMFDNMSVQEIKEAVKLIDAKAETEISGGISFENFENYLDLGVNYISIGKLTHSSKAFDYSLLID